MTQEMQFDYLRESALFSLSIHRWRNVGKADQRKMSMDADKEWVHSAMKLLESDEYEAIVQFQNKIKAEVDAITMSSYFRDGVRVAKIKAVAKIEEILTEANKKLKWEIVPPFMEVYANRIADARNSLRALFNERKYPTEREVETSFYFEWAWLTFAVPENLPDDVREREAEKLRGAFEKARNDMVAALRIGFGKLVDHAIERLTPSEDGKRKIIKDSVVENLKDFVRTFDMKDITQDSQLAEVVRKAQVLFVVDGKDVRDNEAMREKVLEQLEGLKPTIDQLIEEVPNRRFAFDEA